MSLGDRVREWLAQGSSQPTRRVRTQAQPIGGPSYGQRPLQRAQWVALGLAAAAAVALTAGLVFVILTLTRPGDSRAIPTPTLAVSVATATALPISAIFATPTPTSPSGAVPGASPATIQPQPPSGERVQVANTESQGLNVRREPSASAEHIKVLAEGSVVEVIGPEREAEGRRWRNIRDAEGQVGWVPAAFLVPEGTAPVAAATPISGSAPAAVPAEPAATPRPAAAEPTAPARPTSTSAPRATGSRAQVGNTNGQGANIRSEPGSAGRVLKTLPEGSAIEVLGPEREADGRVWRQVRDSTGVTGWIVGGTLAAPGTVPTPVPPNVRPTAAATPAAPGQAPPPGQTPAPGQTAPFPPTTPAPGGPSSTPLPGLIQPGGLPNPGGQPAPTRTPTR